MAEDVKRAYLLSCSLDRAFRWIRLRYLTSSWRAAYKRRRVIPLPVSRLINDSRWEVVYAQFQIRHRYATISLGPVTFALLAWCKKAERTKHKWLEVESQNIILLGTVCRAYRRGRCTMPAYSCWRWTETSFKAVIFRLSRQELFEITHCSASNGHFGVQQTV